MKYKSIHFSTIDSTNSYLKENYKELEDFTFVSSDYQSNGKGRNERIWLSNKGENLLFSLLLKNKDIIKEANLISLVSAVSVCEIIEEYSFKNVKIKWPNDIYINDKKVSGILLEGRIPDYIIIGIGLNVNQKEFLGDYRKEPTSLYLELGGKIDITKLKEKIYDRLYNNLNNLVSKKTNFLNYFNKHNYLKNKKVSFIYNNNQQSGVVLGVDENFNIIIKDEQNEHHISSGEINILKINE